MRRYHSDMRRVALVAILLAVSGCATAAAGTVKTVAEATSTTTTLDLPITTSSLPTVEYTGFEPTALPVDTALVALADTGVAVYARPGEPEPMTTLSPTTILGTVMVATVVEGPVDGWARVMLPIRPNGTTGWVRVDDVHLFVVEGRIVVDLSDRELTYYRGGREVLRTPVAVGTDRNPTPTGHFYVTDSVTLANPGSPWGPHALGLSGRSDTISEYNGGDGIIGIHGTNRPDSIGKAASLGCVRLPNDMITLIHEMVPIGTPVEIRA